MRVLSLVPALTEIVRALGAEKLLVSSDAEKLKEAQADVVLEQTQAPRSLAELHAEIRRVAIAIGLEARGERVVAEMKGKLAAINRITKRLNTENWGERPKVAIYGGSEPVAPTHGWLSELIALADGELVVTDPDMVVVSKRDLPGLLENPEFQKLRAFRESHIAVLAVDPALSTPGMGTLAALEILTEILYLGKLEFERPPLADGSRGWEWAKTKA